MSEVTYIHYFRNGKNPIKNTKICFFSFFGTPNVVYSDYLVPQDETVLAFWRKFIKECPEYVQKDVKLILEDSETMHFRIYRQGFTELETIFLLTMARTPVELPSDASHVLRSKTPKTFWKKCVVLRGSSIFHPHSIFPLICTFLGNKIDSRLLEYTPDLSKAFERLKEVKAWNSNLHHTLWGDLTGYKYLYSTGEKDE